MEALLRPLPPDWRHNIQQVFSSIGEALGNLLGGQQGERRVRPAGVPALPLLLLGRRRGCWHAAQRLQPRQRLSALPPG